MFLLNSCLGQFSAACFQAPLLPKLRGHFAEFLDNASPVGLRILSSSTCVGLRYGYVQNNSGFSWQWLRILPTMQSPHQVGIFVRGFASLPSLSLHRSLHSRLILYPCVPTFLSKRSTGISTSCPSTTPCGLALGPDFPRADQLYSGILGYSAWRILTSISLLIPAFSLQNTPRLLPVPLRRVLVAPLPLSNSEPMASVSCFSPGYFRRRTSRLVSYYALFKCVAASEPTS